MRTVSKFPGIAAVAVLLALCLTHCCQQQGTDEITREEAQALLDRYLEIFNQGNTDLAEEVLAPEFVLKSPLLPEPIVGIEALKELVWTNAVTFPDFHLAIEDFFVKGDQIASRFTITGTQTGPFGELPATGKRVFISSAAAITRVVDGKIVEDVTFWNVLDLYQQLGFTLVPPQPQETE
jgi:steroid delta-isomerase-like uncharacterized protein